MTRTVKLDAGGFLKVTEGEWRRECQLGLRTAGTPGYTFIDVSGRDIGRLIAALSRTQAARTDRKGR